MSLVDSLRATLASNREVRSHVRLLGVSDVIVIAILLLALAGHQPHAVGKWSEHELTSMAFLFGAALLLSGVGIAVRCFVRLQPQLKRLNASLTDLTAEAR